MNKSEFINAIAEKAELKKLDAEKAYNAFIETVTEELIAGNEVKLTGFGTFSAKERDARTGVNPRTGEKIDIAASRAPKFKASKTLKDALNA